MYANNPIVVRFSFGLQVQKCIQYTVMFTAALNETHKILEVIKKFEE